MALSNDPEVRARQLRAIFAKSKGGYGGSSRRRGPTSNVLSSTAKSVAIGASVGAVSTVFPAIIPIYKAYRIAKIGKRIYDAYNKSDDKNKIFDKIFLESTKYGTSEVSKKISENEVSQTAKSITMAAESAGVVSYITKETKIDENIYSSMLEGSLKRGMLSGIGKFTSYAVEGFVGS